MRIRSTKPEFWRSKRISAVSWEARLVLKGLESYVDDNGVGKDDLELIVGDIFSRDVIRDASRTLARVSEAISELHQAGLVWRYEADGNELLYISFWESAQRVDKPQAGRMPRPDGTMGYKDSIIRDCVANPRESSRALAPVTGEQGNRGSEDQGIPPAVVHVPHQAPARQSRAAQRMAALNATARSAAGEKIASAYNGWAGRGIPRQTLIEVAQECDQLLADEIDPHQIAEGIKAWHSSDRLYASQIPGFVAKAARTQPAGGKPTRKATSHLDAAEQVIAAMEAAS